MTNQDLYSWSFPSRSEKGSMWYIIALSLLIGVVIWGFLSRQYVLSFLVILMSGVYFFIENNIEDNIFVSVNNLGIFVGGTFYEYSKIASYTFVYSGGEALLLRISLKKTGLKFLNLKVKNQDVLALKEILPNFIQEDDSGELTFGEKLIFFLKL